MIKSGDDETKWGIKKMEDIEMNVPGEFSELEEAILEYLYAHPDSGIGTPGLMEILRPDQGRPDDQQQAYKDVQYAIETLLAARLVKGERHAGFGSVYHAELLLTPKGEAEAITQRRRVKKIVVQVREVGKEDAAFPPKSPTD